MIFIGIDPGIEGGVAFIDGATGCVDAVRMPATDRDILDVLNKQTYSWYKLEARATLERVSSSPQMGVTSAFTFGGSYRALKMALTACGIPFDEVSPLKWQRAMGCLSGGDKNVTKQRAQQLFPNVVVTHYVADALLLAEYGRRLAKREA